MKNRKIEYRNTENFTATAEGEKRQLTGIAIVYNKPADMGDFTEVIATTALDACDLSDVRLLVNHDATAVPLARSRGNGTSPASTMHLENREDGLHFTAELPETEAAKAVIEAVNRGDITGCSFMFELAEGGDSWDFSGEKPVRTITAIKKIYELSLCTFPAYEQTEVYARSLDSVRAEMAAEKEALDRAEKLASLRNSVISRAQKLYGKELKK